MDMTARLEALAAEPKRFVAVGYWRHADGSLERRERAPQPRFSMAEGAANRLRRAIGKPDKTSDGRTVVLERVAVEDVR